MAKSLKLNYVQASDLIRKTVDAMVEKDGYAYAAGYLSSALATALSNVTLNESQKFVIRDLQVYADLAKRAA